jgi:mono/diheme cytochrome c family protein
VSRLLGASLLTLCLFALAACDDMSRQRKEKAQGTSAFFANGMTDQREPEGTVARGDLQREKILAERPPMTRELLQRGRERFEIYCAPCHGLAGDGHGVVVARGFPQPPDFAEPRLRRASERHFVDVIGNGYGQMYSYAMRVAPADRWAIAAYIRALQHSQRVAAASLEPAQREKLEARP